MFHDKSQAQEPLGTILGYAPGNVPVYSCNYEAMNEEDYPDRHAFRHYLEGVYLGYKWQCVELARRWLYINKGYIFADVAMAYDIFRLQSVKTVKSNQVLPLHSFANGSRRPPEEGSMLIWAEGGMFEETGHVAIITRVEHDKVYFVEQNVYNHIWPEGQDYSRCYPITKDSDQRYWITCEFEDTSILGWVIQTEDPLHAVPKETLTMKHLPFSLHEAPAISQPVSEWLSASRPDEAAYIKLNGHKLAADRFFAHRYFSVARSMHQEIKRAANELHAMFLHATDVVLNDENLLSRFNIPEIIWPKIRQSWANRHQETIVGRMDLAVSDKGIKCFEYNADSASCLMECGKVQGIWAKTRSVTTGKDAGADLTQQLIHAWRKNDTGAPLHILLDDDLEESYHAKFMQEAAEKAGIRCKFLKGMSGVQWGGQGSVLDADGEVITKVWKTWAWETALDQLREQLCESTFSHDSQRTPDRNKPPRLVDILLNPEVMVHEPLWTVIPSNKAILPVLTDLFPDSHYLLHSSYALNDRLKETGYVEKPIVGRCGANIVLCAPDMTEMASTEGQFDDRDRVYQELCTLPQIEGYYVQTNAFMVDGKFAGVCLRVDKSPILTGNSDLPALRIIE